MDDLISRQAAIDRIEPWLDIKGYSEGELNIIRAVLCELKYIAPSVQPDQRSFSYSQENDAISRQAAIAVADYTDYTGLAVEDVKKVTDEVVKGLKQLLSVQPESQWIPCSERLPEDWVPVLVTLKKPERLPAWIKAKPENYFHIVDADVCENGEWFANKKNVIAWMPLPEPYREGGEADG